MLDDLDAFISRTGQKPDLAPLRTDLVDELLSSIRRWSRARNGLFAEDRRPTWVTRQELEQHPSYAKGYLQIQKKKKGQRLSKQLFGRLAKAFKF